MYGIKNVYKAAEDNLLMVLNAPSSLELRWTNRNGISNMSSVELSARPLIVGWCVLSF